MMQMNIAFSLKQRDAVLPRRRLAPPSIDRYHQIEHLCVKGLRRVLAQLPMANGKLHGQNW